jgi:GTP-binding protein Era
MKSGFVAVIGRANVGKSSILNKILGQKVAIVSPRAQTTRDKTLGILTQGDTQIVFVDTPGMHEPTTKLGEHMMRVAAQAVKDVDAVVLVLDAERGVTQRDKELLAQFTGKQTPLIIAMNKVDLSDYETLYPVLAPLNAMNAVDVIPLSAKTGQNIDTLVASLTKLMPEGPFYYPADEVTDKSQKELAAEIVREKILLFLQEEIPHGVQVVTEEYAEEEGLTRIAVLIVCEKPGHKSIIIGKNGDMLKKIGTSARKELERLLDTKVMLSTFVKVIPDWRNRPNRLKDLGFDKET